MPEYFSSKDIEVLVKGLSIPDDKRVSLARALQAAGSGYEDCLQLSLAKDAFQPHVKQAENLIESINQLMQTWDGLEHDIKWDLRFRVSGSNKVAITNLKGSLRALRRAALGYLVEYKRKKGGSTKSRAPTKSLRPGARRAIRTDYDSRDLAPLVPVCAILGEWWTTNMGKDWPKGFPSTTPNGRRVANTDGEQLLLRTVRFLGQLEPGKRRYDAQDCHSALEKKGAR